MYVYLYIRTLEILGPVDFSNQKLKRLCVQVLRRVANKTTCATMNLSIANTHAYM